MKSLIVISLFLIAFVLYHSFSKFSYYEMDWDLNGSVSFYEIHEALYIRKIVLKKDEEICTVYIYEKEGHTVKELCE